MKLLAKFTFIFVLVFGLGLPPVCIFSYKFLQENARNEVRQQARLMLDSALSVRHYTSAEIAPILDTPAMRRTTFLPQTIPFYAATQSFEGLGSAYRDYTYKEATLNPTNLRDRAVDWETDIINEFRRHPEQLEQIGERKTPTGKSLFLARSITAETSCLECHSTPETAPAALTRIYGRTNGFGWKNNDIVGAQIISVPMALPESIARQAFYKLKIYFASFAILTILILDLVVYITVVKPVSKLSDIANAISNGSLSEPIASIPGKDEIATLAQSFNRMHISLSKAMLMLRE